MKRLISLVLLCVTLCGCAGNSTVGVGLQLRNRLLSASECSFLAEITVDYGEKLYTFSVDCKGDKDGKINFCVTQPDTLSGINGTVEKNQSTIIFDDTVLAFPPLADGSLSPVSAPWIMINTLKSGYLTACSETDKGYKLLLDDSYASEALQLEIYTDHNSNPYSCEILWKGRRVVSMMITDFEIL